MMPYPLRLLALALLCAAGCGDGDDGAAPGSGGAAGTPPGSGGDGSGGYAGATGGSGVTGGQAGSSGTATFPAGFGAPQVLVPDLPTSARLLLDDEYVYFSVMGTADAPGYLGRVPLAGGEVTPLATGQITAIRRVNAELVYVDRGTSSINAIPLVGGASRLIATIPRVPADIESMGDAVYYTYFPTSLSAGLGWAPLTGGAPVELIPLGSQPLRHLTLCGGALYVTSNTGATEIGIARLDGGSLVPIGTLAASSQIPVCDGSSLLVGTLSGALQRIPLDGGAPRDIPVALLDPQALAVDDAGIYFTAWEGCNDAGSGSVGVVPSGGGDTVTIATGQNCPARIQVNAQAIFWINSGTFDGGRGSVMRADKQY